MTIFSKVLTFALAGMIGLSASAFAQQPAPVGTPEAEATALKALVDGNATEAQIAAFVKEKIAGATDKPAMAKALIAIAASNEHRAVVAAAAIAAAGRTGATAESVAKALIEGGGAQNVGVVAAAIALSAGKGVGADAVVAAAVAQAQASFSAGAAATAASTSINTTLNAVSNTTLSTTTAAASNDNTGALAPFVPGNYQS